MEIKFTIVSVTVFNDKKTSLIFFDFYYITIEKVLKKVKMFSNVEFKLFFHYYIIHYYILHDDIIIIFDIKLNDDNK
jgi:hypothetical protein